MILSFAAYIGKTLDRAISRLYLLTEQGVYLELQNGSPIELER
jgi:hypothetical protein